MTTPLLCLLIIVAWTIGLTLAVSFWRVGQVCTGNKLSNEFPSGTPHGCEAYWRLNRAHLNALENLPLIGLVILVGAVLQVQTETFATLAIIYLVARILQSTIHIISTSVWMVNLRFVVFMVQLVCLAWMIVEIVGTTS